MEIKNSIVINCERFFQRKPTIKQRIKKFLGKNDLPLLDEGKDLQCENTRYIMLDDVEGLDFDECSNIVRGWQQITIRQSSGRKISLLLNINEKDTSYD